MLDKLRTPFFIIAVVLIAITVLIEVGSSIKLQQATPAAASLQAATPGKGILSLAFLDGMLLYATLLMGIALVIPERVQGRVQGLVTLIFSVLILLADFFMIIGVLTLLIVMVTLLLSPIFGTLAYFVAFGFFSTDAARITLGLVMTLKLFFAGCLFVAHQRFLQNKGLVMMILTSLVATFIIAFLHGLVPGFLVSITDAIGAIIVGILALIWAILLLISSVSSILKAIT